MYELFFESAMRSAGFRILQYLENLLTLESNPTRERIQTVYAQLQAVNHPIWQSMDHLKNYEPFSIIEAALKRKID